MSETPEKLKRPRPVLSCLECRRKKLKCDRLLPCQQCLKLGHPSSCAYAPGQEPERRTNNSVSETPLRRPRHDRSTTDTDTDPAQIDDLNDRVRKLEQALRSQQSRGSSIALQDGETPTRELAGTEETLELEQPAEGEFSIFQKFEDALVFTRSIRQRRDEQGVQTVSAQLFAIQRAVTNPITTRPAYVAAYTDLPSLMYHMVELLPVARTRNKLIQLYFQNFEHCVRIIHKPTFLLDTRRYDQGLLDQKQIEYFVSALIGVLSVACSLNTYPECNLQSLNDSHGGFGAVQLMNNWYDLVLKRDGVTLPALQVRLLSMQTQRYQSADDVELWISSAQLIRQAMTQNLHTERAGSSVFDKELRRCLWLATLEQDLALAISCEMPPMCPTYDLCPPTNCDDDEISSESVETPCYPMEKWTDGLCQHILGATFNQRLEAYKHRFAPWTPSHYAKSAELARSLERILQELPPLFRLDYSADHAAGTPGRLMAQMDLDIALRRPLAATCAPYARAATTDRDYYKTRVPYVQSHLVVMCFQDLFDPQYPALEVPNPIGYWDFFYAAYRRDVVQSVEGMLLEANYLKQVESMSSTPSIATNQNRNQIAATKALRWDFAAMMKSIEDSIGPMKRRVGKSGGDLKSIAKYTILFDCLRTPLGQNADTYVLEGLQTLTSALQSRLEQEGYVFEPLAELHVDSHETVEWLADFLSMET